jgi:hypothetical protein
VLDQDYKEVGEEFLRTKCSGASLWCELYVDGQCYANAVLLTANSSVNPVSVPWQWLSLAVMPQGGNEIHNIHAVCVWKWLWLPVPGLLSWIFFTGQLDCAWPLTLKLFISWLIPIGWIPLAWGKGITDCTSPFVHCNSIVAIVKLKLRRVFLCTSEEACHLVKGKVFPLQA